MATSVTWSKDGTTVSNGGTFSTKQVLTDGTTSMYDNILMINAEPKDLDGTYICTVANAVSTVEDSITVSGEHIILRHRAGIYLSKRQVLSNSYSKVRSIAGGGFPEDPDPPPPWSMWYCFNLQLSSESESEIILSIRNGLYSR